MKIGGEFLIAIHPSPALCIVNCERIPNVDGDIISIMYRKLNRFELLYERKREWEWLNVIFSMNDFILCSIVNMYLYQPFGIYAPITQIYIFILCNFCF